MRMPGTTYSPRAPAGWIACWWTPSEHAPFVSIRETKNVKRVRSYDGQRPLVPWLIRVFQNWHVSQLRYRAGVQALPEDDLALPLPAEENGHWHEAFCQAARECLTEVADNELLILGLRVRYRLSQRDVAHLLGLHEGTISRQTTQLRDRLLEAISRRLLEQGWTGEDLSAFVLNEMGSLLLDDPRLSADRLAALLAARGQKLPASLASSE
jgi:RNA polymerase sigma factor (sigma-70 family)